MRLLVANHVSLFRIFYEFHLFLFMFIYFSFHFKVDLVGNRLSASTRYRGSRESLQSGMTYSARKNSQSSMYNGTRFFLIFILYRNFTFIILVNPFGSFLFHFFY